MVSAWAAPAWHRLAEQWSSDDRGIPGLGAGPAAYGLVVVVGSAAGRVEAPCDVRGSCVDARNELIDVVTVGFCGPEGHRDGSEWTVGAVDDGHGDG